MKDYIELEQVKKIRDEYRQDIHGSGDLYDQEIFFSQYKKEVESALDKINTLLEEHELIANEVFAVPIKEVLLHPLFVPVMQSIFCVLREDGYLYFSSKYQLVALGLGYRMKNGKIEECL